MGPTPKIILKTRKNCIIKRRKKWNGMLLCVLCVFEVKLIEVILRTHDQKNVSIRSLLKELNYKLQTRLYTRVLLHYFKAS